MQIRHADPREVPLPTFETPGRPLIVTIRPDLVRRVLVAVVLLLVLGQFVFVVPGLGGAHLFDLDREAGPGTWVSTTLFSLAGVGAFWNAALEYPARRWMGYASMGVLTLALGLEEVAAFHESASVHVAEAAHVGGTYSGGTPLMGLALLLPLALGVWLLTRGCTRRGRSFLFLGTAIWWFATFGTEQIDAWNLEGAVVSAADIEAMHRLITGFQEGGEMLGVVLVICGLLEEVAGRRGTVVRVPATEPASL